MSNHYSGYGGKSGGGEARSPVESPDNLISKQYARVLDAISEGEIGGLVDGNKSVYLNQVPLQNPDLTYNFTGVVVASVNGTQVQDHIPGFSNPQSPTAVNTEATYTNSVVRSIPSGSNFDAVQVTLGFPQLTYLNPTNGGYGGTSVDIAIDLQNNGGGYVPQIIGYNYFPAISNTGTLAVTATDAQGIIGNVIWDAGEYNYAYVEYRVEYRLVGAATWTVFNTYSGNLNGASSIDTPQYFEDGPVPAPVDIGMFNIDNLAMDDYEVQVVKTGGAGALTIANVFYKSKTRDYDTITGKCTTRYQRSYRINLTGTGPWDIRVRRLTPDSTSSSITNKTFWDLYVGLIDSKYRYPNTAAIGVQVDASQFDSIPTRGYDVRLLKVKIPSNYNPITRVYTGTWDGTFTVAWTDNPAWCFYDLLTNARYGLGEFIDVSQVDKWALYSIAQYCDGLVDNGRGGTEPRFTCNLLLQTQAEAYTVVQNMASMFRAITYWASGAIYTVQDKPADPVMLFTSANVIDGEFSYSGSGRRGRHTVALVSWNDPTDFYKQKVEYVSNDTAIARYGVQQTEIVAVGCTSRGQAHRMGKWLLLSEENELETLAFKTGLEGTSLYPGAIIKTIDPHRAGTRFGGRLVSATATSATIDNAVTIETGHTYTLNIVMPDGSLIERVLTNAVGDATVLTWASALTELPQVNSVWILEADNLVAELWRVINITEESPGEIAVSALSHNPNKFTESETGIVLQRPPTSNIVLTQAAVETVSVSEALYIKADSIINRMTISWTATTGAIRYFAEYKKDGGNWTGLPNTTSLLVDVDAEPGVYYARVTAINSVGAASQTTQVGPVTILGKTAPPPDVDDFLVARQTDGTRQFTWSLFMPPLDLAGYQIRYKLGSAVWADMTDLHTGLLQSSPFETNQLAAGTYTFAIKAVDTTGNESANAKYISLTIGDPRLAGVLAAYDEQGEWSGTKTSCHLETLTGYLQPNETDATPWAGTWARKWIKTPAGTIVYERKFDVGALATFTPLVTVTATGTVTIEEAHSTDDITYTAYVAAGAQLTTRYIKIRATVVATWPELRQMTTLLSATPITEDINDLATSTLTGANRIAVGDIRLPKTKTYGVITGVNVTLQNVGAGWSWELIDKDTVTGPRIKIYNAANALADATIDATIKGL